MYIFPMQLRRLAIAGAYLAAASYGCGGHSEVRGPDEDNDSDEDKSQDPQEGGDGAKIDAAPKATPQPVDASAGKDAGLDSGPVPIPTNPNSSTADDPLDTSTRTLEGGRVVKSGWNQIDLQPKANWDGAMVGCPDPDAMVVPGTVAFHDGTWTLTGSGEGFMHGWDQGNLVYLEKRIRGDFDFTAQTAELSPNTSFDLNGAAEAVLNVRDGLDYKAPANSVVAGRMKARTIFFARFNWKNESPANGAGQRTVENKYWYWPAWPEVWPKEPPLPWARISRRGAEFHAYVSKTGTEGDWQEIKNADNQASWYPYKLKTFGDEAILGLVCTARNDHNLAPKKTNGCRDENSAVLKQAARCIFKNVSIVQK